jgi:hypothetical protein
VPKLDLAGQTSLAAFNKTMDGKIVATATVTGMFAVKLVLRNYCNN